MGWGGGWVRNIFSIISKLVFLTYTIKSRTTATHWYQITISRFKSPTTTIIQINII